MPGGRPSLYNKAYCEQIEKHMKEGYSASSFGGVVGVSMECISEWRRAHPEFSEAVKRGQASRVCYWEGRLLKSTKSDALPIIFALKNVHPEDWRDRREVELNAQISVVDPMLLAGASQIARQLQENTQIIDIQTVEPKQIVDQTVKKEEK